MGERATVALRDGLGVRVRFVGRDDQPAMLAFLIGLSEESRLMRFLSACIDLEKEAALLTDVHEPDRFGVIATFGTHGPIIGHACYERIGTERAESAVVVADEVQRRGLGTLLLRRLAGLASRHGIKVFEGEVLPENHRLLACVHKSFPTTIRIRSGPGWMRVEFSTTPRPGREQTPVPPTEEERAAA